MKYLIVYYNNTTKEFYNDVAYASSIDAAIYNFKHYSNITDNDKITNIIKME